MIRCLSLVLLIALFFSCDKNQEDIDISSDIKITGTWKLVQVSGGLIGNGTTTDWNKIQFKGDKATFYNDNKKLEDATIAIKDVAKNKIEFSFASNTLNPVLDIKGDPEKNIEVIGSTTLMLNSECCDRYNYKLEKE